MPVTGSRAPSSSIEIAEPGVETGIDDFGKARTRNAQQLEQPVVPPAGAQVEQQRAARVGGIGHVMPMAGELNNSQLSIVPKASSPRRRARRAPGIRSSSHASLVAEK